MNIKKMKLFVLTSFVIATVSSCGIQRPEKINTIVPTTMYNDWSVNLLKNLQAGKEVSEIQKKLADVSEEELQKGLPLDEQRKAFWINIYNGYIIATLRKDKSLFDDRGAFFTKKQIDIAGHILSFDDIENGMIRKSRYKYGLGYIEKLFPPAFERHLRVKQRDFRIHFAINCGAKSCPPVRIYGAKTINEQLQNAAKVYLTTHTKYNKTKNTVETSTLMSWFRGDFGGKSGSIRILKEFNLVPNQANPSLSYGGYDWTLDINNFAN